jgi:hypothetical protein
MSLLDFLRQEYVKGKVIDKYRLSRGNIGMVVEEEDSNKRYHVEFKDNDKGPSIENLFGLFKYPFEGKTEHVDRLVNEGDSVELTLSYSKGPMREAYYLHSVYRHQAYRNPGKTISLPYRAARTSGY